MNKTNIPWADYTWNPITGCTKGCEYCYARAIAKRFGKNIYEVGDSTRGREYVPLAFMAIRGDVFPYGFAPTEYASRLDEPLRLKQPSRIFLGSMGDLFDDAFPDEFRDRVFATVASASWHTFLLLTKQPKEMRSYWRATLPLQTMPVRFAPSNLWLGVTVTNQADADERIPLLLDTPAAHRFVSVEPMMGPVEFQVPGPLGRFVHTYDALRGWHIHHDDGDVWTADIPKLDLVIAGAKTPGKQLHDDWTGSGDDYDCIANKKPWDKCVECGNAYDYPACWLRSLRDQCLSAGVPFMYKHGGTTPALDGVVHDSMPGGDA